MDHQNLYEFARTIFDNVRLGWRQHRLAEKLSPEDIQLFLRAGKALEFDGDNQDIPFRLRWKQSITNSRADAKVYLLLANFLGLDSSTAYSIRLKTKRPGTSSSELESSLPRDSTGHSRSFAESD